MSVCSFVLFVWTNSYIIASVVVICILLLRYPEVWAADADAARPLGLWADAAVEPAAAVQDRATRLVRALDARHGPGAVLALVAHGDLLQILQTAFARADARAHRSLPHLETAEVRFLELAPL